MVGWADGPFADLLIGSTVLSGLTHFAILYYLLGSKARRITAPDYREAVEASRDVRSRRSWSLIVAIVPLAIASEWRLLYVARDITPLERLPIPCSGLRGGVKHTNSLPDKKMGYLTRLTKTGTQKRDPL